MQELFRKYLDNQCSPAEVKELLARFSVPENEDSLREFITESLENVDSEDDGSRWNFATDEIFVAINRQRKANRGKLLPIAGRLWFRVAAAVVLLAGGLAVYNLLKDRIKRF